MSIENRNSSIWDDDRRAAAFVTVRDPAVLGFAKAVASIVRNGENQALDYGLRTAMAMHQALNLAGLGYVPDPKAPYESAVKNTQAIDYLQFPRQTLSFKSGDCDDLAILYSALLSAASVDTAFITVPGHIYIAAALDASPEGAVKSINIPEYIIVQDGRAWVPLEVTLVRESFLDAWAEGAREWRASSATNTAKLYPLAQAWELYQPVGLPGESSVAVPQDSAIIAAYREEISRVAHRIVAPKVKELEARISLSSDPQRLINSLGVVYAKVGLLDQAEEQFTRSQATRSYTPALVNLGNIWLIRKSPEKALEYFQSAVRTDGGNPAALAGLTQALQKLGRVEEADTQMRKLTTVSPRLAQSLTPTGASGSRAAEAGQEVVTWDE